MQRHRWRKSIWAILAVGVLSLTAAGRARAEVQAGDTITKDNMDKA